MAGSIAVADLAERMRPEGVADPSLAPPDLPSAWRLVRAWTRRHHENFPVLSSLVPPDLRDDFSAVYAFCRAADDLGDEVGDPARSLEMLAWWRRDLERAFAPEGSPRHPVFVALRDVAARRQLDARPFHDLISAFELDQVKPRHETFEEVLAYCRQSADPVGRIVLRLFAATEDAGSLAASDAVCTGLQLANHWQDARRDLLERDRIYLPREVWPCADFEEKFRRSATQGFAVDAAFLAASREMIRGLVERTSPYFEEGRALLPRVPAAARPVIELFIEGGEEVLRRIAAWDHETILHRPRIGRLTKAWMVARAWGRARLAWRRPR